MSEGRQFGGESAKLRKDFERAYKEFMAAKKVLDRAILDLEKLEGKRGTDRAVRQSDLKALASYGIKSPAAATGTLADDYVALRADIARLYELLAKVSNLYGTAAR